MFKLAAASAFAAGLLAAQSGAFAGEWVWRDTNVPSCKKLVDSGGSGNIWGTVDSAKVVAVKGKCPETIDGMATMQAVLIGSDSVKFLPSGVTCYGEYQKLCCSIAARPDLDAGMQSGRRLLGGRRRRARNGCFRPRLSEDAGRQTDDSRAIAERGGRRPSRRSHMSPSDRSLSMTTSRSRFLRKSASAAAPRKTGTPSGEADLDQPPLNCEAFCAQRTRRRRSWDDNAANLAGRCSRIPRLRAPVARGRRAGDAGDLYPSRPQGRRPEYDGESRARRRHQAPPQKHAAPAAAYRRRAGGVWSATPMRCRSASAPPIATPSSTRSMCTTTISARGLGRADGGADRRLRGGGFPADDRLYRGGQRAVARLHEDSVSRWLLTRVGYKFGRWTDRVMVQRPLGHGDTTPPER